MLFMEFLRMRAGNPQSVQAIGRAMDSVQFFSDNFIGNLQDLGAESPELEADLRRATNELLEVMQDSEENFIPLPRLGMGDN